MGIYKHIEALIEYGLDTGMINPEDQAYTANRIFEYLDLEGKALHCGKKGPTPTADHILEGLIDWAAASGRIPSKSAEYTDIFDAGLMNCLMGRPSEVVRTFETLSEKDPVLATDYLYQMGVDSNYIRMGRIQKNQIWQTSTPYGDLDITINLSKPEKDPKVIAAALKAPKEGNHAYPSCLLCAENEGYRGRVDHPGRQNLRLIPLTLNSEAWMLQYSPYSYYNEHCIVLSKEHVPMKLTEDTLKRLVDFVEQFPHYFIGSNADLPIVGGSILTHDHFQGGQYEFAMTKAPALENYILKGFEDLSVTRVNWPMTVIRISGTSKERVVSAGMAVFEAWKTYSDPQADLISHTGQTPHNTVTPIARRREGLFEMDIVLRNNRTSEAYPDGIFHPHPELHHIKKENIGLIEVMGLAVLPGRLKAELEEMAEGLSTGSKWMWEAPEMAHHKAWYESLLEAHPGGMEKEAAIGLIQEAVGYKFLRCLEDAGVFKLDGKGHEAFERFMKVLA